MEDIIRQKFEYAKIILLKDYCMLNQRASKVNFDLEECDFGESNSLLRQLNHIKEKKEVKTTSTVISLPEKYQKGKKTKFYYGTEKVGERIFMDYARKSNEPFIVTNDRIIKRNFANPYASMSLSLHERSIIKYEDKITIKLYTRYKDRNFNNRYFRKSNRVTSITINLKTGNFTVMNMTGKSKSFRTNCFTHLVEALRDILTTRYYVKSGIEYGFLRHENDEFLNELFKIFGGNVSKFMNDEWEPSDYITNVFVVDFINWFTKTKQIKTPNKFHDLIYSHYPTEKFLKKNDRKLVASVLEKHGIKTKYTIKLLHEVSNINLVSLKLICDLLGYNYSKYLYNINEKAYILNKNDIPSHYTQNYYPTSKMVYNDREKEYICSIINSIGNSFNFDNYHYFVDHYNMLEKIRPYQPDLEIRARTWNEFRNEHNELSKIINTIKKGYEIQYTFSPKMLEEIEKPVTIELKVPQEIGPDDIENLPDMIVSGTFYPFILKTESDYQEEGSFMHHCVASYSDKDKSIIVSIRTKDKSDRITCEIDTQTGNCLQARHFCNKQPPEDMAMVLEELKPKFKKLARFGLLNSVEKKKVPIKINGIEIVPDKKEVSLMEHLFLPF